MARQAVENRRKDLDKLSVKSPIDGRVASVKTNPGDAVAPAQLLVSIVDDTSVFVTAQVAQADISKFKVGQTATVGFGSELPSATGVVDSIGVEANGSASSTARNAVVPVMVKVANTSGVYRVGLIGNVNIKLSTDENVSASGPVAPNSRYDLRAEITGTVNSVSVRDNDTIKAGQLLLKITNDNAEAALKQAESDLSLAVDNLQKIQSGLVPNITEDDAKQQQFRVRQAEIAVQTRSVDVNYLEPKSPLNGTVVGRHVTRGDRKSTRLNSSH